MFRKHIKVFSLLTVSLFLLSSCAAMFHGTSETIYIRSDEPNTKFYAGARELGKGTSAVTTVSKKDLDDVILRASKEGCNDKSTPIETEFDAITLLGILIDWGLISILIVDWAATGAVTQASQTDYILTPDCN